MKLTRRQEEFINKLLELHQEYEGPIHYSLLADRLGVSPFTAYDMLCVLEDKGVVTSEFQLASDKSGPGRAERCRQEQLPRRVALRRGCLANVAGSCDQVTWRCQTGSPA